MAGGYGALAKMMASHRNQEVFRKFSTLNVEIMLHMQAELLHLELVIDEARKSDKIGDFDRGWLKCAKDMSQEDIQEIFERSRTLMKQYRMFRLPEKVCIDVALMVGQRKLHCERPKSMLWQAPGMMTWNYAGVGMITKLVETTSCADWRRGSSESQKWRRM